MAEGYLSLILHGHLPYVRHPEHEYSLEEKWYYEAVLECYIPILIAMERLERDEVDYALTFSLSPTLLSLMEDRLIQERCGRYIQRLHELAEKEVQRTAGDPIFAPVAQMYRQRLQEGDHFFNVRYERCLTEAFRERAESGHVELITSCATHGYLPLLAQQKESVYAQVAQAVEYFASLFGQPPRGIWLPECAYQPGIEETLGEFGIQYFITATHGVLYAAPRPKYGVYSPILTNNGIAVFGRDPETTTQVWSKNEGYPGDYYYREFYRDIGYDLDFEYIKDYLHPPGMRGDTGLKYHRITGGRLEDKEPYIPERAREKAAEHAGNFMFNREKQVEYLSTVMDRPPIIVAPYDAELFGHWWYEGPEWLEFLCRKIHFDQQQLQMITPGEYLDLRYPLQVCTPCASSWGNKGYHEVWLNSANDWLWRHLHHAAEQMIRLATDYPEAEGLLEAALNQAARELLLAQSSDWPFIMTAKTMDQYARRRAVDHLLRFRKLEKEIRRGEIDAHWLAKLQAADNIFPYLDYRLFQRLELTMPVEEALEQAAQV
ncbi:MAG: glycoside hydrolase family 57 protein [Dethiobacteria bacterium]|jgi:1,4-alpha-glucan branching enzyme